MEITMRTFAMTGGATGIGAELRRQLQAQGHKVISVDIKEGDIVADLSTDAGRQTAIDGVRGLAPDGLDGFIPCAGLPPVAKPLSLIARVNYFAVVATVVGLRDLLEKKKGSVLLVSSNSAPMIATDDAFVQACLAGDEVGGGAGVAASGAALDGVGGEGTGVESGAVVDVNAVGGGVQHRSDSQLVKALETRLEIGAAGQDLGLVDVG